MSLLSNAVIVAFTALLTLIRADSLIPVSSDSYAYQRGNPSSNVVVEFYLDLGCSGCRSSWSMHSKVYEEYADRVNFLYHLYPMPIHQAGFTLSQAAQTVDYFGDEGAVFNFMDLAMKNQPTIYNDQIANMTYNQVVDLIGSWAMEGTGVTSDEYYTGMNTSTDVGNAMEMNVHYAWKFGALHDIFQLPSEYINGVWVTNLNTLKDWETTLDSLLVQQQAGKVTKAKLVKKASN